MTKVQSFFTAARSTHHLLEQIGSELDNPTRDSFRRHGRCVLCIFSVFSAATRKSVPHCCTLRVDGQCGRSTCFFLAYPWKLSNTYGGAGALDNVTLDIDHSRPASSRCIEFVTVVMSCRLHDLNAIADRHLGRL